MKRDFKIDGVEYTVVDKARNFTEDYKYDLLFFNKEQNGWNRICSCNTLSEAREIAHERIIIDIEAQQQEKNMNDHIKEILKKEHFCTDCGNKIVSQEHILNGFDTCEDCLKKYY